MQVNNLNRFLKEERKFEMKQRKLNEKINQKQLNLRFAFALGVVHK